MERKSRKLATEKQILYANAIAKSLEIDLCFKNDDPYYTVSKFIKENEEYYKENIKMATPRQIDYANAISDELKIEKKFDETALAKDVAKFISDHGEEFALNCAKKKYLEEKVGYINKNGEFISFPFECCEFMSENLYGKHGVYAFLDGSENVVYIGKSINLADRITGSYHERQDGRIEKIMYYTDESMANAHVLELILINKYKPIFNTDCKSDDDFTLFPCDISIEKDFKVLPYFSNKCKEVNA